MSLGLTTHGIGTIFGVEVKGGENQPVLEVAALDEKGRVTELKVLSRRTFAGEDGLADIALKNTDGRSACFKSGDYKAINIQYGAHPCSRSEFGDAPASEA